MNTPSDYPDRIEDVLNPPMAIQPDVLGCARRFARQRPWRGTLGERRDKFRRFHADLAAVLGVTPPRLVFSGSADADSTRSCFVASRNAIILRGPLSVVTLLHEWGHVIHGQSEWTACRWSLSVFRHAFPASWSRATFEGHVLRRPTRRPDA